MGAQRTFRPDQHINRDAMAAFLHRLAGSPSETGNATFRDVGPGMMFREEISWLASTGITTGWADGTFRPLSTVTRDAMAAFLYRMAGSPRHPTPARAPFRDVPPSMQFSRQISWLASTGISTGWPDDTFRPLQPLERGAMAAFLHRYDALGLRTSIPLAGDVSTFVRDAEAAILVATSSYRADAGARALSRRTEMDGVARTWSTTMATTGRFEHNPRYAEQIPGGWRAAAENIAYRSVGRGTGTETGRALALQWFNSPGHQANMLRAGTTHIGIGVHVQDGVAYGTQVFAQY
ncbi:S-layer homology domain-containing protein [Brachybacterium sp. UNK5269]|uniref:CAP and S-layer homology domain-containing protein n=1 Tax=Brachybacterium sp. UNK5269 TaxID=3408576 RepID=UPI003BB0F8E6